MEMLEWRQAVDHENNARRNYEAITGQYSTAKLFKGKLNHVHRDEVNRSPLANALKNYDYSSRHGDDEAVSRAGSEVARSKAESCRTDQIITFGKFNVKSKIYKKFDGSAYKKPFQLDRMQSVKVGDGMVDAH